MAKKSICPLCKQYIEDENIKMYKGKKVHGKCLNSLIETKDSETDEKGNLINYICKLYKLKEPTELILNQIKKFKEEKGYTYSGIHSTLHYFYELEENPVPEDCGIGIVPFIYEEARKFYKTVYDAQSNNKNFKPTTASKTIKIIPPNRDLTKIDISTL